MKNIWKIIVVLLLVSSVIAVVLLKRAENKNQQNPVKVKPVDAIEEKAQEVNQSAEKSAEPDNAPLVSTIRVVELTPAASSVETKKLPRLVDMGADKCIPCKMMAPILKELAAEYKGKLQVVFLDVWKNPQEGPKYKIRVIPTQIFFDADGKELFRHEGFFSKEDILAKWKKFGFDFSEKQ
jgi:thioredoxin 1